MDDDDARQETSLEMDESFEALLCYSFGWVTGIVFLIMEKKSLFVRFHALQSVIAFAGLTITMIVLVAIPRIGFLLASCLWFLGVALWAALMWKAFRGEWFRLPVIGSLAHKLAGTRPAKAP